MIIKNEVESIQKEWSDGLLLIVNKYISNEDFVLCANSFIDKLYNYQFGDVFFKPTLASEIQFRRSKESALSYFIGDNSSFPEDKGFALKQWTKVRWENSGIQLYENIAVAMGNYYFTDLHGEIKIEFSFVYKKDNNNRLRIILHDSHLPYQK
jgi:hypothetical protein|tara:strand:+ start:25984 stop:26442 length:459 start_codon:yes stop_codon:yes gene_type:complete